MVKEVREICCVSNDVILNIAMICDFGYCSFNPKLEWKKTHKHPHKLIHSFRSLFFELLSSIVCGIEKSFRINASEKRAGDAAIRAKLFEHRKKTQTLHIYDQNMYWMKFIRTHNSIESCWDRSVTLPSQSHGVRSVQSHWCSFLLCTKNRLNVPTWKIRLPFLLLTTTMPMNERVCGQ